MYCNNALFQLVGLVKVSLHQFYLAYCDQQALQLCSEAKVYCSVRMLYYCMYILLNVCYTMYTTVCMLYYCMCTLPVCIHTGRVMHMNVCL